MKRITGIAHPWWIDRPPIAAAHVCNNRGVRLVTSPDDDANFTTCQAHEAPQRIQPKSRSMMAPVAYGRPDRSRQASRAATVADEPGRVLRLLSFAVKTSIR